MIMERQEFNIMNVKQEFNIMNVKIEEIKEGWS